MTEQRNRRDGNDAWSYGVQAIADGARLASDVQRRLVAGETRLLEVGPTSYRVAQREFARYARDVAELTVAYYRGLAEAARDYGEHLAGGLTTADPLQERDRNVRDPGGRPTVRLGGHVGTTLEATFTLENTDPRPVDVTVATGDCRASDGTRFTAPVTVEPEAATIPANSTIPVTLRASLQADVFDAGASYVVPVHVQGPQPTTIDVSIDVEPSPVAASTSSPTRHVVRCPRCQRTFDRKTDDLRLRPHKDPAGVDCPERDGVRAG